MCILVNKMNSNRRMFFECGTSFLTGVKNVIFRSFYSFLNQRIKINIFAKSLAHKQVAFLK